MPTIGNAGHSHPEDDSITSGQATALRVVGWLMLYLALVPPVTVLLWRLAFTVGSN